MDCIVHGVVKSSTQLSDFHFTWEFYIQLPGLTGMARGEQVCVPTLLTEYWA